MSPRSSTDHHGLSTTLPLASRRSCVSRFYYSSTLLILYDAAWYDVVLPYIMWLTQPSTIQVCRRGLISSEVALLYHLELAKAGMVHGPLDSCRTSLSDRLENLRAYQAAWWSLSVTFDKCSPQRPQSLQINPMTGGVLP